MLVGLIAWLITACFTFIAAYLLFLLMRSDRAHVNAATFLFLWIFLITVLMFFSGVVGFLDPIPILLVSLFGLWVFWMIPSTREAFQHLPEDIRSGWDVLVSWWAQMPTWLQWFTLFAFALSLLRFAFLILSLPPFVWDSLTYHLTNVAEWVQSGSIRVFDTAVTRIYSPANFEVLTLWFTTFLHHDVIVEASGLPAYILALLSVYSIARLLGFSRSSAWFGTLAYATTPALLLASTGTKNDPHMAAYFLFTLVLVLNLLSGNDHHKLGQSLAAILAVMLALGTKTYMVHIAPGLLLVGLMGVRANGGARRWVGIANNLLAELKRTSAGLRWLLVILLLIGAALGLYWNIRNWVLTGNPFFPYSVTVSGVEVAEGIEQTVPFGLDRLQDNLELLAWKFGDRQGRVSPDLPDTTGWGWFVYAFGFPTLIWGLMKRRDLRVLTLGLFVSVVTLFMSNRPSPWNMRYLLWLPALFSFSFAAFFDRVLKGRLLYISVVLLALLTMGANFISVWNYARFDAGEFRRMLSIPIWERGSAQLGQDMPAEYANTLELVPRDAVLGYHVRGNGFIYPLYRPDFSQKLVFIPIDITGTCEQVADAMQERGTRYLFVAPVHTKDEVLGFLHRCGEAADVLQERSFNLYVLRD